jgi:hypothetical protein
MKDMIARRRMLEGYQDKEQRMILNIPDLQIYYYRYDCTADNAVYKKVALNVFHSLLPFPGWLQGKIQSQASSGEEPAR